MVTQFRPEPFTQGTKPLADRVAIVTGASRGIGAAIAAELGHQGARLVVNFSRSEQPAKDLVDLLKEQEIEAVAVRADVSDPEDAERLVRRALDEYGKVDILVNNAGITRDKTMKNLDGGSWDEVLRTNLSSAFHTTRSVLPLMISNKWGRVVNISSIIGQAGGFGQSNYAASKAGMIGFTKSVALEVAKFGITVNAVCPGFIETDMLSGVPDGVRTFILGKIPLGRFGQPEEVARVVRFLAAEGCWITGQEININGGQLM